MTVITVREQLLQRRCRRGDDLASSETDLETNADAMALLAAVECLAREREQP